MPKIALFARFAATFAIVAGTAIAFAFTGGWLTPHALSPARMIDTFESINGPNPGFRRNHAKGICFSGNFTSNGNGTTLSSATIFLPASDKGSQTPVIGRFALAGGMPYQADEPHTVRSMAVLFRTPDGQQWRTGMNNIPVFPVASAEAFYELLIASKPLPATGKPDPAEMKTFFAGNPESAKAIDLLRAAPVSSGFDNSTFNSLDAFRFINDEGKSTSVRWSMVPEEIFAPAGPAESDKNYLFDALISAVHAHPLKWHLLITVAQPGDPTNDATLPWPPDREQIDVGTLTIDQIQSEETSPARDINFDPTVLPAGIKPSDDPLLSARSAAYSPSFTRREGESKQRSAISTTEAGK